MLTGSDATKALQLYAKLGAADATFDGRKVAVATTSRTGRARVTASLHIARQTIPVPGEMTAFIRIRPRESHSQPRRSARGRPQSPDPSPSSPPVGGLL